MFKHFAGMYVSYPPIPIAVQRWFHTRENNFLQTSFTNHIIHYNHLSYMPKQPIQRQIPRTGWYPKWCLKALPNNFQDMTYQFFLQCYHQKAKPNEWKHSNTILLHNKEPYNYLKLHTHSPHNHHLQALYKHANIPPHYINWKT